MVADWRMVGRRHECYQLGGIVVVQENDGGGSDHSFISVSRGEERSGRVSYLGGGVQRIC